MAFEAQLTISDGTTTINLINLATGIHLNDWTPAIAQYKGGGVFRNNPQAPGRRLVSKTFDAAIETFDLKVDSLDRNALIRQMQEVLRLLEKATDYWISDWQSTVVYLTAQAECEDNPRYAEIVSYSIPQLDNPYAQPFLSITDKPLFDNITLAVERAQWKANIPGNGTGVQASSTASYDSRTLGRSATTSDEVYVGSKQNVANITHIFVDDGGVFGANLMDAALPYNLFPAAPALNDAVYFGIDTTLTDSGPFSSLVFDIGTAGATPPAREYWDGGAWAALTVSAGGGTATGVNSIHWEQPSDWATTAVNGVTAYWVRFRMSNPPSAPVQTQQNRDIYSIVLPHVNIDSAQVAGDIPALLRIRATQRADRFTPFTDLSGLFDDRIIIALRSTSRGSNFTPYLNFSEDQNPAVDVIPGVADADLSTATGQRRTYNPSGIEPFEDRILFTITTNQSDFFGSYHIFVRCRQVGGNIGDINLRVAMVGGTATSNLVITRTRSGFALVIDDWNLVDLGTISFPPLSLVNTSTEEFDTFKVVLEANCTSASPPDLYLNDIILIPIDEWSSDTFQDTPLPSPFITHFNGRVDVDSVSFPKRDIRALVRNASETDNDIILVPVLISNGQAILQANAIQRLYFLAAQYLVIQGTHTGANNQATLTDAAADFVNQGVEIGTIIHNTTDSSFGEITGVTATTITATLLGGTDNDWDTNDAYFIITDKWISKPGQAQSIQISKNDQYLGMRGNR